MRFFFFKERIFQYTKRLEIIVTTAQTRTANLQGRWVQDFKRGKH